MGEEAVGHTVDPSEAWQWQVHTRQKHSNPTVVTLSARILQDREAFFH
jgi:hypothetical protein